jgi:hypothetical protein
VIDLQPPTAKLLAFEATWSPWHVEQKARYPQSLFTSHGKLVNHCDSHLGAVAFFSGPFLLVFVTEGFAVGWDAAVTVAAMAATAAVRLLLLASVISLMVVVLVVVVVGVAVAGIIMVVVVVAVVVVPGEPLAAVVFTEATTAGAAAVVLMFVVVVLVSILVRAVVVLSASMIVAGEATAASVVTSVTSSHRNPQTESGISPKVLLVAPVWWSRCAANSSSHSGPNNSDSAVSVVPGVRHVRTRYRKWPGSG